MITELARYLVEQIAADGDEGECMISMRGAELSF